MVKRNSSRPGGNRPRIHPSSSQKNRSTFAKPKPSESNHAQVTAQELKLIALRIKHARAVVVTTAAALRHQNADHDADMALSLEHAVAAPLLTEIERVEKLVGGEVGRG